MPVISCCMMAVMDHTQIDLVPHLLPVHLSGTGTNVERKKVLLLSKLEAPSDTATFAQPSLHGVHAPKVRLMNRLVCTSETTAKVCFA